MRHPFLSLDIFDRFFDENAFERVSKAFSGLEESFPKSAIKVDGDILTMQLALAGYQEENLHIDAGFDWIQVKGDKVTTKEGEDENLFASRAFTWSRKDPHQIWNMSEAQVTFKNGMLTIKVPKKETEKAKTIQINKK
jgi:HSP20 family molecular chaperone IbpA